jgi:hypothetical protein
MSDWRDELERWLAPFMDRFGHKARRRMVAPTESAKSKNGGKQRQMAGLKAL